MYKRILVKVGTSVLTGGTIRLHRAGMIELVRQCAELHGRGHELIVCSSGAIAAGKEVLDFPVLEDTLAQRQMLAAVGQSRLMNTWESLFDIYGIRVGQMLLTRADIQNRQRFLNAQDVLLELIGHKIVPIINENDAVATAEIKVGDNDSLSALGAILGMADLLILLTDQPGLFTADPRTHPDAKLIDEVHTLDQSIFDLAGKSVSGLGTGGMITKLQAANVARRAGIDVVIAAGSAKNVICRIVEGEAMGTRFPALETPLEQRKRWIFAGSSPEGELVLDAKHQAEAGELQQDILPLHVHAVKGRFKRGDTVLVFDAMENEIARGIVRYDNTELDRIKGCRSEDIEDILGYDAGPVIHKNDLIILPNSREYGSTNES